MHPTLTKYKKSLIKLMCIILIIICTMPTIDVHATVYGSLPANYEYVGNWSDWQVVSSSTANPSGMQSGKDYVVERTSSSSTPMIGTVASYYTVYTSTCPICGKAAKRKITGTWNGTTVTVYGHGDYGTDTAITIYLYEKVNNNTQRTGTYSQPTRCDASTWGAMDLTEYKARYIEIRQKAYTIKYAKNKPSDAPSDVTGTMNNTTASVDTNVKLRANAYSLAYYHFTGWKNGNNNYVDQATVKNLAPAGGSVTLQAQWAKDLYNLNYNPGSYSTGEVYKTTNIWTYSQPVTRAATYSRTGYVQDGWSTTATGAAKDYNLSTAYRLSTTHNATVNLYPHWLANKYTVIFNKGSASSVDGTIYTPTGTMANQTFTYDVSQKLTKNAFKLVGYTFNGWKFESNTYNDEQSVKNLTTVKDGTVTLTAQWSANKYYVQYLIGKSNGGGSTATTSHTYGQNVTLAANGFKGRSYKITFDGNRPYTLGAYTIGYVQNLPNNLNGNLDFNKWSVAATNNSGQYEAATNLGVKNFENTAGATAKATALWNSKVLNWGNPTLVGYDFAGWYYKSSDNKVNTTGTNFNANNCLIVTPDTQQYETTIQAKWIPRDDTKYVVKHWVQNVDALSDQHNSTNFTVWDTDNLEGTSDTYVSPKVNTYEGCISPPVQTVRIQADGSTVVNYYYERIKLSLNVDGEYLEQHFDTTIGLATFDVYINNRQVANDVRGWSSDKILYGSEWCIKDINPDAGKHYSGMTTETEKQIITTNQSATAPK